MPYCYQCGTQTADSDKFCQQCGYRLGGRQAADPPTPVNPEVATPTPVDSEPVQSETETALSGSQAEASPAPVSSEVASPTPVDSEPVQSETETSLSGSQAECDTPVSFEDGLSTWKVHPKSGIVSALAPLGTSGTERDVFLFPFSFGMATMAPGNNNAYPAWNYGCPRRFPEPEILSPIRG